MRRLLGTLVTLSTAVMTVGCSAGAADDGAPDRGSNAWVMCERFVEQRMGDGQDFGGRDATQISGEGAGPYVVRSTVNGDEYRCEIETDDVGGEWTLINLNVNR